MKLKTIYFILGSVFLFSNAFASDHARAAKADSLKELSLALPADSLSLDSIPAEKDFPLTFGFDLVSRYVWRGIDFGFTPAFQPGITYSVGRKKVNFEIGAWGSYSIGGNFAEMDLYATLSFPYVWVGMIDYFFPLENAADDQYFRYGNNTLHVFEGLVGFEGPEKFPITAFAGYNFHSYNMPNDPENPVSRPKDDIYFEIGYPFSLRKDMSIDVFVGGANGSYYTQNGNFNIVNVGFTTSKSFNVKDKVVIPLSLSLIANPDAQKVYFVAAVGLWNQ